MSECRKNWDSRSTQLEKITFFNELIESLFRCTDAIDFALKNKTKQNTTNIVVGVPG